MNKLLKIVAIAAALLGSISCNKNNTPDVKEKYPLVVLINEGGYQTPMDMIGYNEDKLELEGTSMANSNEMPLRGEFHGIVMDATGQGYPLMSNYDVYAQVDMSRFKIVENNVLTDLAQPKAMTISGYYLYVLNEGKADSNGADSAAYVSVYSSIHQYQLVGKVNIKKGGTAIYVDDDYIYIAGKDGIDLYSHQTKALTIHVETPAEPKQFLVKDNSSIMVSCPGYGICLFDLNTKTIMQTMEVPVGANGVMSVGKDPNDVITFTDTEVYITNVSANSSLKIYEGTSITGVGHSPNTFYTYISDSNGERQLVFNEKREQIASFSAPKGSYSYLFTNRVIYKE